MKCNCLFAIYCWTYNEKHKTLCIDKCSNLENRQDKNLILDILHSVWCYLLSDCVIK